ncbi:MAG: class I SAM-dependent methyltransferase [Deltaproteobacteria bacterium]|nr:class I SAM-dependent methyltransferase [Deltaproteobacteria bacterium]
MIVDCEKPSRLFGRKMFAKFINLYLKVHGRLFGTEQRTSLEAIIWAYRLFLDREPENPLAVADELKRLANTVDIRNEFLNSDEFKKKNACFRFLSLSGNEPPMSIERVSNYQEIFTNTQKAWESLGEKEPYWSVVTSEQFKSVNIKETKNEFYHSGFNDVTTFFKTLERNGIDHASFRTCLEYGCGLGRVTFWLAEKFETVTGYDISRSHLQLARRYLDESGIQNVSLHHIGKPEEIRDFPKVDAVYSVMVLQHNPPPVIRLVIQELIRALNPGGIAFFQVPTYRLQYRFSLEEYLESESKTDEMEMHVLPQNEIFEIVDKEQGKLVEILEDGYTGSTYGERSNIFIVQKK